MKGRKTSTDRSSLMKHRPEVMSPYTVRKSTAKNNDRFVIFRPCEGGIKTNSRTHADYYLSSSLRYIHDIDHLIIIFISYSTAVSIIPQSLLRRLVTHTGYGYYSLFVMYAK